MPTPQDLQNQSAQVPWSNKSALITGAMIMGLFATVGGIFATMGTWSPSGVYTPTINGAAFAPVAASGSASDLSSGTLPCAREPLQTGDVSSPVGSCVFTLPNINANVGTYGDGLNAAVLTVNAKGQVVGAGTTPLLVFVGDSGVGGTQGLVPAPASGDAALNKYLAADGTWKVPSSVTSPRSGVRQTMVSGPSNASGAPSFLNASSASLQPSWAVISAGSPLSGSAAQGFGPSGPVDYAIQLTSAPTGVTCPASNTDFLYLNAQTGVVTCNTLVPIYQYGGTISVANNQFTFDYQAMVGYLGNGTTANQTPLIALGECTANASSLSGCIGYAYNGYYQSPVGAMTLAANSFSHNLGVVPGSCRFNLIITTAANNYSVGDIISGPITETNTSQNAISFVVDRKNAAIHPINGLIIPNKTTAALAAVTTVTGYNQQTFCFRAWGGA